VAQLQNFVHLTIVIPALAVRGGTVLTLAAAVLAYAWRSVRGTGGAPE
jgi:hypothetical protein